MIEEICAGALILGVLAVIAYLLFGRKPVTFSKNVGKTNTTVEITANRNLHKVSLVARFGNERIKFERKRVRKGQTLDFVYPSSDEPAELIVEIKPGKGDIYEL
jgi:hypothetical protein